MPQTPNHTTQPPSSQAAAYGYKHAGSMARYGVSPSLTVSEPENMAYGGSVSVGWYSSCSESGYSFPIAAAIGIGARYYDSTKVIKNNWDNAAKEERQNS